MEFNFEQLTPAQRYEFLLSTIAPRPIALITTRSADGVVNAAPFSQFTVLGHDPAIVAIAIAGRPDGRPKDTSRNILATGEFVINMVSEAIAQAMNITSVDAPEGVSETVLAELETIACAKVASPRIARSPVSLECRFVTSLSFNPSQAVVLGRVVHAHIADEHVLDASRCLIDTPALQLIGVMHGARWYARTADLFAIDRPPPWSRQDAG